MNKHCPLRQAPKRILLISLRHIGDLLLTTGLIRSLHRAYPQAEIDVMVYSRTAAVLVGNPDINQVITVPLKPSIREYWDIVKRIFRRYQLAIATQAGDRPLLYSLFAASQRIGLVPDRQSKGWWKRYFFQGWSEYDGEKSHAVIQFLRLMDVLEQPRCYQLVPPQVKPLTSELPFEHYAVLHLYPLWNYKRWHLQGWLEVANYLLKQGVNLVLTGGPGQDEINYVNRFHQQLPEGVVNLAGKTSLNQLTGLITQAKLFIGPDTGVTHLASITGTPTIAVFGPTNPVKWAPWPFSYARDENPFVKTGSQHVNNVHLIQGPGDCVPCQLEGCEHHRESYSRCLDQLPATQVIQTVEKILANGAKPC
ncbi:glycosyltransferase family 9 protein [methane-oxidizing endosymbiont of Gigantopelta aegis]|uniref:glycosyltransferase family 9 protein n=1 Tax=methane-oxidizing endosymbiont of Gigantopelta aegis TaxID=2794938 RepID=UPI0018DB99F7|nr:glycosyltransferase family 9 protein [methane-oxidizing endosymbiont of Gigantopelta aegis]